MPIEFRSRITRNMLRAEREKLFVFGDNIQRIGLGGQAKEMRGEPNAVGLPTKHSPGMRAYDFLCDDDIHKLVLLVNKDVAKLKEHLKAGKMVVWPSAGIGTGLADLKTKAPTIAAFYDNQLKQLRQL